MPETWERLSKRQQAEAVVKWERDSKIHADARKASDIPEHVSIDEISRKDYKDLIEAAVQEFSPPDDSVPEMATIAYDGTALNAMYGHQQRIDESFHSFETKKRKQKCGPSFMGHNDEILFSCSPSAEFYALVHMPIASQDIRRIPGAAKAVDGEFDTLAKRTWLWKLVKERSQVIAEAKRSGYTVHFGSIMELCHLKHAELSKELQKYKGRIVFRGDIVKDEDGVYAVFSEQGAAASKVEAARFVDALARMPGCGGFNVDAIKAFNQIKLPDTCPSTWRSMPRHRWPKEWEGEVSSTQSCRWNTVFKAIH